MLLTFALIYIYVYITSKLTQSKHWSWNSSGFYGMRAVQVRQAKEADIRKRSSLTFYTTLHYRTSSDLCWRVWRVHRSTDRVWKNKKVDQQWLLFSFRLLCLTAATGCTRVGNGGGGGGVGVIFVTLDRFFSLFILTDWLKGRDLWDYTESGLHGEQEKCKEKHWGCSSSISLYIYIHVNDICSVIMRCAAASFGRWPTNTLGDFLQPCPYYFSLCCYKSTIFVSGFSTFQQIDISFLYSKWFDYVHTWPTLAIWISPDSFIKVSFLCMPIQTAMDGRIESRR